MRMSAVIGLALALSACASQPQGPTQAENIRNLFGLGKATCASRFPTSPKHNHVAQAQCYNEFIVANIIPQEQRDADLYTLMNAKRLVLAEEADKGLLSEAEVDSRLAETAAYATSEAYRRNNASAQTQAQMAAARAAQ
jgi:hypothetical protein